MTSHAQVEQSKALAMKASDVEEGVLRLLDALEKYPGFNNMWLHNGRVDIQRGFMQVRRALYPEVRRGMPNDIDNIKPFNGDASSFELQREPMHKPRSASQRRKDKKQK